MTIPSSTHPDVERSYRPKAREAKTLLPFTAFLAALHLGIPITP